MGEQQHRSGIDAPAQAVTAQFYPPPEQFDGCFTSFYTLELDLPEGGVLRDFLQPEWGNIRFFTGNGPRARIGDTSVTHPRLSATGPSSLPCEFELGTSKMWGIGLLPLGWARFIDTPAVELANIVCDGSRHPAFVKFDTLSDALCDPDADAQEQFATIVEMMGRMMRPNRDEPKIVKVHEALVSGSFTGVKELADACAMSVRTLERVCGRYFGFTPKLLMRRQRFMRSLTSFMLHQGARWTEAMDGDYHDQAQFTREFNTFMTMNPSEYASLDHPILASFMEARARIWGSAAQTLDRPTQAQSK